VIEALPVGAVILDRHGRILNVNDAFASVAGRGAGELIGFSLLSELTDGSRSAETQLRDGLSLGSVSMRVPLRIRRARPGETRPCRVWLESFEESGQTLALGLLDTSPEPAGGEPAGGLAHALQQISSTKHNLNNLIMGLMGHTEILLGMDELPHRARAKAEVILEQSRRLRDAVQSLEGLEFRHGKA
jgi:PAS domain S-box-containing protein